MMSTVVVTINLMVLFTNFGRMSEAGHIHFELTKKAIHSFVAEGIFALCNSVIVRRGPRVRFVWLQCRLGTRLGGLLMLSLLPVLKKVARCCSNFLVAGV